VNDINDLLGETESSDDYDRMRINDTTLTQAIGAELARHAKALSAYCCPPKRLVCHHQWFLTRYPAGGSITPHVDGTVTCDGRESIATILIYLNDDFKGGQTVFLQDKDSEYGVTDSVCPRRGSVLVLRQDAMHKGCTVEEGTKYLIRGDLFCGVPDQV
jgi:predicted 2-oxoglutarate/Fe(II)-dependent dioxygenase YbiX